MSRRSSRRPEPAEDGFVMVVVILVMAVALMVGGIAVADSVSGRQTSFRDLRSKHAQAAADNGIQQELYRANEANVGGLNFYNGLGGLTSTLVCNLGVSTGTQLYVGGLTTTSTSLSCPNGPGSLPGNDKLQPTLEDTGNRQAFRAWFLPNASVSTTNGRVSLAPVIVAEGHDTNGTATEADDIIRRSMAVLKPIQPFRAIEATGSVTFRGLATTIHGDVLADKDFTVRSAALVGLNLFDGLQNKMEYGGSYSPNPILAITAPTPTKTDSRTGRTVVSVAANKPECGAGGDSGTCPAGYSAATKQLNVTSGTVTLAGGDYVFCSLTVAAGATLTRDATTKPVRIFIDDPSSARCAGVARLTPPATTADKGNILINGQLAPGLTTDSRRLQLYVAGNGTPGGTTAQINTDGLLTATASYFFYGPDTDVTAKYLTYQGSIIGHDVTMNASGVLLGAAGVITQDLGLAQSALAASVGAFKIKQYIECPRSAVETPKTQVGMLAAATAGC